jgi:hypothetical protein
MLQPLEAFKAGFLLTCADLDMDGPAVTRGLTKLAQLLDALGSVGTAALAAPVLVGAGAGWLGNETVAPGLDAEDYRKMELIEELRRYARRAKLKQNVKTVRAPVKM